MPTEPQHLLVYLIVLATLVWIGRRVLARRRRKPGCASDCGCDGVKRDPTIQRVLDKRRERE
ncbi:MAG: FeoB-associated Cys-rich membrane protein [Opitutales bacterium]